MVFGTNICVRLGRCTTITWPFFCTFLHKHPKDSSVADNKARWWPEWRELLWDDENNYEFGDRILFSPAQKPDLTLFGKFGTELNFNTPGTVLVGPFSFLERSLSRAGRCFISDTHWKSLNDACQHNSLTPPTLSNDLRHVVTRASILRSTLNEASSHCEITEVSSLTSMLYIFCKKKVIAPAIKNCLEIVRMIDWFLLRKFDSKRYKESLAECAILCVLFCL